MSIVDEDFRQFQAVPGANSPTPRCRDDGWTISAVGCDVQSSRRAIASSIVNGRGNRPIFVESRTKASIAE